MSPSAIEWTEETWNPVVGCSKVSPGCARCYAEVIAKRFGDGERFPTFKPWTPANAEHNVMLKPERLEQPLRWRRPRMVFVNSMSDLFHENVPDDYIAKVWNVMDGASRHTFQVLTKRPERARDWLREWYGHNLGDPELVEPPNENVWLGTSIENSRYTWRADVLREIPAAVRFISAEPLLGSLFQHPGYDECNCRVPEMEGHGQHSPGCSIFQSKTKPIELREIDWLIVGGESGVGARPLDLAWARELVEAARLAGAAPFVKQLGAAWAQEHTARGLDCGPADPKGGDPRHWPPGLRVRELPPLRRLDDEQSVEVVARRLLDVHDPEAHEVAAGEERVAGLPGRDGSQVGGRVGGLAVLEHEQVPEPEPHGQGG